MSEPENPTECARFEAEWNRLLDGGQAAFSPARADHALACDRCAALRRGLDAIRAYRGPALAEPAPAFAAAVLRKRDALVARRARRRTIAGFAVAASLLLALWVSRPGPERIPKREVAVAALPAATPPTDADFRRAAQQWRAIGTDVASATRRAAGTPLEVSGKLLAMQPLRDIDALHNLEPVTSVFANAGESAYDSFEPLRKTAEMNFKSLWQGKSKSQ